MYASALFFRNLIYTLVLAAAATVAFAGTAVPAWSGRAADPHPGRDGWYSGVEDRTYKPGRNEGRRYGRVSDGAGQLPDPCGGDGKPGEFTGTCDPCGPLSLAICPGSGDPGGVGAQLSPLDLLQREVARLRVPLPAVATAPPRGADGRVGLPEWFWLNPAQRQPITRRAQAGPVWVELTASPQQMTISPGSGLPAVTCPGVGAAYSSAAASSSACTYTFARSSAGLPGSAYAVTATVVWGGTWRGSGGTGGALTPISVSDTFSLRIGEAQALTTGGGR